MIQKKKIRTLLFDLGNTLFYFNAPWPSSFTEMSDALLAELQRAGLTHLEREPFSRDFFQRLFRNEPQEETGYRQVTASQNLIDLLRENGIDQIEHELIHAGLRKMFEVAENCWTLEDDTHTTLRALKASGYQLGSISNAEDPESSSRLVHQTGLDEILDASVNSAAFGYAKPGAAIFMEAMRILHTEPAECVMVGDALEKDILGANRLGIRSVWITGRIKPVQWEEIEPDMRPWRTIRKLSELPALLEDPDL